LHAILVALGSIEVETKGGALFKVLAVGVGEFADLSE
jgi:hypothetical protein